jgi:hypothetical protein
MTITAPTVTPLMAVQAVSPCPSARRVSRIASSENQTSGGSDRNDRTAKVAMPSIEPAMSIEYALSGSMLRRSGPSGNARLASSAVVRMTAASMTTGSTLAG